jgi:hypothetical protein
MMPVKSRVVMGGLVAVGVKTSEVSETSEVLVSVGEVLGVGLAGVGWAGIGDGLSGCGDLSSEMVGVGEAVPA